MKGLGQERERAVPGWRRLFCVSTVSTVSSASNMARWLVVVRWFVGVDAVFILDLAGHAVDGRPDHVRVDGYICHVAKRGRDLVHGVWMPLRRSPTGCQKGAGRLTIDHGSPAVRHFRPRGGAVPEDCGIMRVKGPWQMARVELSLDTGWQIRGG
jgi:hypothetical protein